MAPRTEKAARLLSVVAAFVVSMACGLNYGYSAWAPEFGDRLKLSSTQTNLIGIFGNLGTYSLGIPLGIMVDKHGPRPGSIIGALSLGLGYLALWRSYDAGTHAPSMFWLCFFNYLTGMGSCSAFLGSVKTSALNWPNSRGTATAFPLAAYGLSAFFFSVLSNLVFPDDTSGLLLLFTITTFCMIAIGGVFLRIVPRSSDYSALASDTELSHSSSLDRARIAEEAGVKGEPGTPPESASVKDIMSKDSPAFDSSGTTHAGSDETSSLLSKSSTAAQEDGTADPSAAQHDKDDDYDDDDDDNDSRKLDIRGFRLLPKAKFWQIWIMLGLLTGIGLMTINNIGSDARAIWHHWDDSVTPDFIQDRQMMHVEIISFLSFCGRLSSGVGSDLIVLKLHMSRYWCLLLSSLIFLLAQLLAASIQNPNSLSLVSGFTGYAYGILFGVCPTLVVEAFGVAGLSQNWGIMTLAPILFGNIFNLIYGRVFDAHSVIGPEDGVRECDDGLECYRAAYLVTVGASVVGVGLSLWSIRHDYVGRRGKGRGKRERDERREA